MTRLLLLMLLCAPVLPAAAASCRSSVVDSRSLRLVDGHPVVTVSVNGTPVSMLLDTGAEASSVTTATVARFRLPVDPRRHANVTGVDGTRQRDVVHVTLGIAGPGRGLDLPVIDLPGNIAGIAGVVGTDVLATFDMDLDQPGEVVVFHRPGTCTAADPPWDASARPALSLPASFTRTGGIRVPVRFGPVAMTALLDTGNPGVLMGHTAAVRAGLGDDRVGNGAAVAVAGAALAPVTMRVVEMGETAIGPDRLPRLSLTVAPLDLPNVDMLLGNDYAGRRRLLVSWARQLVVVQPPE